MSNSIKTAPHHAFHTTGLATKNQSLFTVTPGIPLLDALHSASDLLSSIEDSIHAAAMGETPLEGNAAWLVNHTLASAKSVIDCLIDGAGSDPQGGVQ